MTAADGDPREELQLLARSLRAHLQWQAVVGTTGLPAAPPETARSEASSEVAPVDDLDGDGELTASVDDVPAAEAPRAGHRVVESAVGPPGAAVGEATQPSLLPDAAPSPLAALADLPLEARRERLPVLAESIRGCQKCPLHEGRTQTVFARGTGASGVCFVGEGPGAEEDRQGYPFVGAAGQLLDKMIGAMKLGRDDVYICNVVKCRPPKNRKPTPEEMAACLPYLEEQLALVQPKVIVALGATAVHGLFGTSDGITRMRGKWRLYRGQIPVMPTFHPAYLLRNAAAKREVWADLQAVMKHLGNL